MSRFNGLSHRLETVETVSKAASLPVTGLKPGANGIFPKLLTFGLLTLLFAGCAVGPDYQRPADRVLTPAAFRGETPAATNSLADLPWWRVFNDDTLQTLVHTALTNNFDLRIAVTRVEQARAVAAQARGQFYPQLDYGVAAGGGKNIGAGDTPSPTGKYGSVLSAYATASWELDLWGKLRRLNESARAQYLASQEARRDVQISLIAQVAQNYFQLLALDRQLEIARQSTNSYGESLKIFKERLSGGVASKLETASAEALMDAAAATIPDLERQIVLQENQLSVLLGQNPAPILRGTVPLAQQTPPMVPAGLPSALLERRPDIREAEDQLRSANAQVGVAKANFFPQLDLTGLVGEVSPELNAFTSGGQAAWGLAAGLTGPLFHGGQLRAQYAQARAARDQAVLQYEAAVLNALQEIANALVAREKLTSAGAQQARAVDAYQEAVKIAMERYRLGEADYYQVLQEQQLLFPAENSLVQFQLNRLLAVVQLYSALGGGWEMEAGGIGE
jgi:multidrug efflux system outer membrane protein